MKRTNILLLIFAIIMATLTSCTHSQSWKQTLEQKMPYLGHRNWIVITDMAYPLQSGKGITTVYADQPYLEVLKEVKKQVDSAPHVFAHVWRDREVEFITEDMVPGIDKLKESISEICGKEARSVDHETLIKRLDEAGKLYQVIIIKTPLTIPYTTTFFELDCAYWDANRQSQLDEKLKTNE